MLWETAETYHRLHSVLTSSNSVGDVKGLALALTSLNLARHAHIKPRIMAEIYLILAIRLKLSWPKFPTMFQRFNKTPWSSRLTLMIVILYQELPQEGRRSCRRH